MHFTVMTLFPEMIEEMAKTSIFGNARKEGFVRLDCVNFRDYSKEKHRHVDDYPYGGGPGMLIQAAPVYDCYRDIVSQMEKKPRVIYLTPQGKTLTQETVQELAKEEELIFLCGHYEGIDERVLEEIVTDEISIGDYVLTGGELPALVLMDAISRSIPGVLASGSAEEESFSDGLLEYPQYTRPEEFLGKRVPEILLSGHHANILKWQREQSLKRTFEKRPDLLEKAELTVKDREYLKSLQEK